MCGRFTCYARRAEVADFAGLLNVPELPPRFNIAPTQSAAAVRLDAAGARELVWLRWGLVPSWARGVGDGPAPINARADTVALKPMFRTAFRSRRCLVPASGFYEWQTVGKAKQPYLFRRGDGRLVALAALWERWRGPDGTEVQSFAVITTEANAVVRSVHDRMPVFVEPNDFDTWLALGTTTDELAALLRPYPAEELVAVPVSRLLNNPRNDSPEVLSAS